MFKKLSKYGNSFALIIDKPVLELLEINEATLLKITTDGKSITIIPVSKNKKKVSARKKVQQSFDETLKHYAPALKKLADN